jgi:hypothetical protein
MAEIVRLAPQRRRLRLRSKRQSTLRRGFFCVSALVATRRSPHIGPGSSAPVSRNQQRQQAPSDQRLRASVPRSGAQPNSSLDPFSATQTLGLASAKLAIPASLKGSVSMTVDDGRRITRLIPIYERSENDERDTISIKIVAPARQPEPVLSSREMRQIALREALREYRSWERRYKHFSEFAAIFAAAEGIEEPPLPVVGGDPEIRSKG